MANRCNHMPNELSGGQKQRVAIARCLAMHPNVILFDEPTSALDPTMVDEVESVIQNLAKEGMTSVIVTHEMAFAKSIATKVVYLDDHGIYETGTPQEIFDHPSRPKTRAFVDKLKTKTFECVRKSFDLYQIMSEIRSYCIGYGFSLHQIEVLNYICEEIVYRYLFTGEKAILNLRCSVSSEYKDVTIDFPDAKEDPLKNPNIDTLGIKIITGMTEDLVSVYEDGIWVVKITINTKK